MKVFISGGCKNGKSYHAQRLAKAQQENLLYYIATMKPVDDEDNKRIIRHREERHGQGFITIEQPSDIKNILERCDRSGSFLLDSLTALLTNEMFLPGGAVNRDAANKIVNGLARVIEEITNIVIVSDYIYSDAAFFDSLTETYRMSLAVIDKTVAEACDIVLEATYSNIVAHKGKAAYETIG
jgi:adenosylcobinamide kinase/adenosylcobinamide-phosphate guanylyltransferase